MNGSANLTCVCTVRPCGEVLLAPQVINVSFAIGSSWFVIDAAKRGVLEKIVIKEYRMPNTRFTFGQVKILYIDTFNRWWNGTDLCTQNAAVALAIAYYENLLQEFIDSPCQT